MKNERDQRKFHRIDFDGQARLEFSPSNHSCCQIKNLSLTGMFVAGDFRRRQHKNCFIQIFHKEKSGNNSVQAFAEIVWCNKEGAGLRFTSMTLEHYILLQTTLIAKAEHPEVILRELPHCFPYVVHEN